MDRAFYLHFRFAPPESLIPVLTSHGVQLSPVFETSFDVLSPLSFSDFKYLLKTEFPEAEYTLVKAKASVSRYLED